MATLTLFFNDIELSTHDLRGVPRTIGRDVDCPIRIDSLAVAPRHLGLMPSEAGYQLLVLDPDYPVLVNNKQVEQTRLDHGDLIRIGKHSLLFSNHEEEGTAPSRPAAMDPLEVDARVRIAPGEDHDVLEPTHPVVANPLEIDTVVRIAPDVDDDDLESTRPAAVDPLEVDPLEVDTVVRNVPGEDDGLSVTTRQDTEDDYWLEVDTVHRTDRALQEAQGEGMTAAPVPAYMQIQSGSRIGRVLVFHRAVSRLDRAGAIGVAVARDGDTYRLLCLERKAEIRIDGTPMGAESEVVLEDGNIVEVDQLRLQFFSGA